MARLDRNRGMFFGTWTGTSVSESASASIGSSTGITAATVTAETFGTAITSGTGVYTFTYSNSAWRFNSASVQLTTYGITVTGTPASGDTVIVTYTAASSGWDAIGKDTDDLSKDLNPDTESGKNVLGEATFKHSGYKPEISVDPYFMDPSANMYEHMLECALEEKYGGDDLIGKFAEAFFTSVNTATQTMSGYAYVRDAWFIPQSVGGDTAGYSIPYKINPVGAMTKMAVSYSMATNEATFTTWSD